MTAVYSVANIAVLPCSWFSFGVSRRRMWGSVAGNKKGRRVAPAALVRSPLAGYQGITGDRPGLLALWSVFGVMAQDRIDHEPLPTKAAPYSERARAASATAIPGRCISRCIVVIPFRCERTVSSRSDNHVRGRESTYFSALYSSAA
jgi:hypothetical protein